MPEAQDFSNITPSEESVIDAEPLLRALRRKEGSWVEWGQSCQQLQKANYSTQQIFEETGFEPIQQNQVIVAAQVYTTMANGGAPQAVLTHFEGRGSDVLYELRILTQTERVAAAELALEKGLDLEEARELAKAIKEVSRLSTLPEGFSAQPGDAIAYQSWKAARQKSDLQERSRLIARGLKFAQTPTARQKLEQLLTDFSVVPTQPAPRLPLYRLESEDEVPRILPVVGKFPLTLKDLQAVPMVEEIAPFRLVKFSGTGAWVPIPGWQVVQTAGDPVVILLESTDLPTSLPGKAGEILLVVDREQQEWDSSSYFVVDQAGQLQVQWFSEAPATALLGRVVLIMRPKKILDESITQDLWQLDE